MIVQEEVALQPPSPGVLRLTADGLRHLAKRAVDVVGALMALFLLWPVMVSIALLIKFTSRGPILFQQPGAAIGAGSSACSSSGR